MWRRPITVFALAALATLASACSEPEAPVRVGVREVPTDVVIGTREVGQTPAAENAPGAMTTPSSPPARPSP